MPDIDLWYNPTYDNYFRLLNALEDLGQDVNQFKEEQAPDPLQSFFRYEFECFTLDLLPQISAPLKFRAAFDNRAVVQMSGVDISFMGFEELIKDKEATARPKDIEDIRHLRGGLEEGE